MLVPVPKLKNDLEHGVKVLVGPDLKLFLEKLAAYGFPDQRWALRWVMTRLNTMAGNGEIAQLGPEFAVAAKQMGADVPGIDLALLHRSEKTKSGFVGVYANGKGYRAMAPDGHNLGTFPTSERAAWERYLYCRKHTLTYGPLEEWLVKTEREMFNDVRNALEAQGADMPLAYRRFAIYTAAQNRVYFEGLSAEDKAYETTDPMETYFSVP